MAIKTLDSETESTPSKLTFEAGSGDRIQLPSEGFVADAVITRDGDDLLLQAPNGEVAVVKDYYSVEEAPLLQSPNGTTLTPELVNSFSTSSPQYAANETASDESPVGAAEEVKGGATVTRTDGSVETISIGTPIYQGDVIQTEADGAVNIRFMDETSMAVSQNARMSVDNYSFDAKTESGETDFSVLRGVFVFTSGLIGRDDPDDVHITTPVGSIGIRGTIIAGDINPAGESSITVLEGAIVVTNSQSETTLSRQFETVHLTGFDTPMQEMGIVPAADINTRFESVSYVVPTLFSTIQDSIQEETSQDDAAADAPVETKSEEEAPEQETQQQDQDPAKADPSVQPSEQPMLQEENRSEIIDPNLPSSDTLELNNSGLRVTAGESHSTATASSDAGSSVRTSNTFTSSHTLAGQQNDIGTALPPSITRTTAADTAGTNTTIIGPPPALTFSMANLTIGSTAANGTALGVLSSNAANQGDVTYTFATANTHFSIVRDGAGNSSIILTTNGYNALRNSLDPVDLNDLQIIATHSDSRTAAGTIVTHTTDGNIALNLNAPQAGVTVIHDDSLANAGYSITAMGDMDGDGFDDFAFTGNASGLNKFYMVHGAAAVIASGEIADVDTAGRLTQQTITRTGLTGDETVIAGIGDYNGDGQRDYVIGHNNAGGSWAGNASIVDGSNTSGNDVTFTSIINSRLGEAVAGAGDYNNDGYADVLIGAPGFGTDIGRALLVFGRDNFDADPILSSGGVGTHILSDIAVSNAEMGYSVAGIGDMNGDGYSDFAVGAPGHEGDQGYVKIYYGQKTGVTPAGGVDGMQANARLGEFITGLGDIDGDGYSDMLIGGDTNMAKIIFGGSTRTEGEINLTAFSNYTINGGGAAGDFNGDGFDDMTLSLTDGTSSKIYVVYGGDGFSGFNSLNYLKNASNAFEMTYNDAGDLEISKIGDLNGDGYDDIAIGVTDANGANSGNGGVIIVNGRDELNKTTHDLTATADKKSLIGTTGADTFSDGAQSGVSMRGGAGNDIFGIRSGNFLGIDGGGGSDTIRFTAPGGSLNFSSVLFEDIEGIETLQYGTAGQTITLTVDKLFNLLKGSDNGIFTIDSDYAGTLIIDAPATVVSSGYDRVAEAMNQRGSNADYDITNAGYAHFDIGGYDLYIDTDITVNVV